MTDRLRSSILRSSKAPRLFLAVATAIVLGMAPSRAHADIRIVSVKTDTETVRVDAVSKAGTQLTQAGRSEGTLFVETGSPDTEFACEQDLRISLSDGRVVQQAFDLCALNYAITVKASNAKAPETDGPKVERKLVMIRTDDDTAIREVFVDDVAMTVRRRSNARVFVEMEGDPDQDGRIACRRNLRLVLADGRILRDDVDICGDWKVTVATKGTAAPATRTVRRAVPSTAEPNTPPRSGGVRRPTTSSDAGGTALRGSTEDPAQTRTGEANATKQGEATLSVPEPPPAPGAEGIQLAVFEDRTWYVEPGAGGQLALVYGARETDDRGFMATCTRGSDAMTVTLVDTVEGLAEGEPVSVTLAARDVLKRYTGQGSGSNTEAGVSLPLLQIAADDPIWTALVRGSDLSVALNDTWRYRVSLAGSAGPVRRFRDACARAAAEAQVAATPQDSWGSQVTVYANRRSQARCVDEGAIRARASAQPATMIFRNDRRRPVVVYWIDFDGNRQIQARVPPGGEMIQPTVVGHPWLVATPSGRCLGIYLPQGPRRTVTILPGRPDPVAPPIYRAAPPAPAAPLFGDVQDQLDLGYDCNDGSYLAVTIDNVRRLAIVRESGLSPVTLSDRSNGPDFYYISGGYELVGSGAQVTWVRPGARAKTCRIF